jgi:hypothetical protein
MNLFRSEEHVRNWPEFQAETEAGILSLIDAMAIMSTPRMSERFNGRYISTVQDTLPQFVERLLQVTDNEPFWDPRPK